MVYNGANVITIKILIIMELTVKDRILIANELLPRVDTMRGMELATGIAAKMKLSDEENEQVVINREATGIMNVGFKNAAIVSTTKDVDLTDEELDYIKIKVNMIDRNGMISADNIATYKKILDTEYIDENYEKSIETTQL